jgi:hypothetical protein
MRRRRAIRAIPLGARGGSCLTLPDRSTRHAGLVTTRPTRAVADDGALHRHALRPDAPADRTAQLADIVRASPSRTRALAAARQLALPSWCIGAGAVRNVVWDRLHGFAEPSPPADVHLAYFDAAEPPDGSRRHQAVIDSARTSPGTSPTRRTCTAGSPTTLGMPSSRCDPSTRRSRRGRARAARSVRAPHPPVRVERLPERVAHDRERAAQALARVRVAGRRALGLGSGPAERSLQIEQGFVQRIEDVGQDTADLAQRLTPSIPDGRFRRPPPPYGSPLTSARGGW